MEYQVTILDQGFLTVLSVGFAYARARTEGEEYIVVFAFDADEERAATALASEIASRFPDAMLALAADVSLRDGVVRARVVVERKGLSPVAAVSVAAGASVDAMPSRVVVELDDRTYVARPVAIDGGYRVDVERTETNVEPTPTTVSVGTVALLERVTAKLRGNFADPEGGGLYRAALRDLGIAYRRAGQPEKATAALLPSNTFLSFVAFHCSA